MRVGNLETLKAIATFSFLSDDIKDRVDKLSTFGVMFHGPVVIPDECFIRVVSTGLMAPYSKEKIQIDPN